MSLFELGLMNYSVGPRFRQLDNASLPLLLVDLDGYFGPPLLGRGLGASRNGNWLFGFVYLTKILRFLAYLVLLGSLAVRSKFDFLN